MVNLSCFIIAHARRGPEREALLFDGQRVTYGEFAKRIQTLAAWLEAREIGPGDVVAVLMKNSVAFLEIAFAASHIGAVFLPINFRLAGDEVGYIVENSGAKLLFVDSELAANARGPAAMIEVDAGARRNLSSLCPDYPAAEMHVRKPSDIFRLMYTSGTTDRPKGVIHTYDNFYWKSIDHVIELGLNRDTRLLVVGPLYHVGAFDLPGIAVLWTGGLLYIHRDFDPAAVLGSIEAERLDAAWLAPVMTSALLGFADRHRFDVGSLRWAIGGGERTPEPRIRAFSGYFLNARYIDGYGLTESCSGDTLMEAGREIEKIGSTGRALAHVEIEIRDEAGQKLDANVQGEICLRGPKITQGYWRDPERTAASFHGDWFRTGDIGYLDAEGFLFLTDRKKDMIISGGENIASSEVERVILELRAVREVAVVGLPDETWGERPVAFVALEPGAELDFHTLAAHCRSKLAGFKVPKALVIRDALPRNPSGKLLKCLLRAPDTQ